MNMLNYIIWTFDPALFSIPGIEYAPRWYGVLFATGFIVSQQILLWVFTQENRPAKDVEKITSYMVLATIIGARLGHCLFYDPAYFLSNPLEILMVWKGGLASHGGALGILVALYIFCKKYNYRYLWILDRMVIVVALTGALIRTGNLFNSEMEGTLTHSNTGIVYARAAYEVLDFNEDKVENVSIMKGGEMESSKPGMVPITARITFKEGVELTLGDKQFLENQLKSTLSRVVEVSQHVDFGQGPLQYVNYQDKGVEVVDIYGLGKVRHAAQLYEAVYCLLLMTFTFLIWYKKRNTLPQGFNFAFFMIILWVARFLDEFFKMPQEAFEENMTLNMGQLLSVPLSIVGVVLMIFIFRGNKKMSDFV